MKISIAAAALLAITASQALGAANQEHLISMRDARARAVSLVPGGQVRSAELEREHGLLVYSFDIVRPRRSGVEEVLINARTGQVVSRTHETPAMERQEARTDARRHRRH